MGTVILSPQDCLSSPHNRQNYHYSSVRRPKTDKSFSQTFMVPLSVAEDCARQDYSGGSPPQDGILPIPQLHGEAKVLSKRPPFPAKMPSLFCTPPAGRTATSSASPMVKPKLSRSASAILPTPLTGSPPRVEGDGLSLLKGRLPLKVVQGNGVGNFKVDVPNRNNPKKHVEARHGAHKKNTGASLRAVNSKVVEGPQEGRPSKPLLDGADFKGKLKKVGTRKQRSLERSQSSKGPHERHDQQGQIPPVTILQRPKTEEAAAELFAKFFQNTAGQDVVHVQEQADCVSKKIQHVHEMIGESEIVQQRNLGGSSDLESLEGGTNQASSLCSSDDGLSTVVMGVSSVVAGAVRHTVLPTLVSPIVDTYSASRGILKDIILESGSEELAPWERWAGPSYINSPPPSALPLPRFSRIHSKNGYLATADGFEDAVSDQASTPPSALPAVCASLSGQRQLCVNSDTVASATKDLKRILNLDLFRV